jgi:2-dehydro-3-deoxyphosphogluconate aldolase / (4S)-4-hydroxy-2-oxoglutarate aldolase
MMEALHQLLDSGVVFVLRGSSPELVVEEGQRLASFGADVLEVTWTVPDALQVLAELRAATRVKALGMGTVASPGQVREAVAAGADFLVTPGYHEPTVREALTAGVALLPGVATAGEVMAALDHGLDALKLFPALGGPELMQALSGPFPQVSWVPSGGIAPEDAGAWFQAGARAVSVGSSVASLPPDEARTAVAHLLEQTRSRRPG